MTFSTILDLSIILPDQLIQIIELVITFVSLFGMIFYLLITADNKKILQKQK